ncbi:MAG: hypothetical protein ACK5Z5_05110 [Neisseriaceae bacterium]
MNVNASNHRATHKVGQYSQAGKKLIEGRSKTDTEQSSVKDKGLFQSKSARLSGKIKFYMKDNTVQFKDGLESYFSSENFYSLCCEFYALSSTLSNKNKTKILSGFTNKVLDDFNEVYKSLKRKDEYHLKKIIRDVLDTLKTNDLNIASITSILINPYLEVEMASHQRPTLNNQNTSKLNNNKLDHQIEKFLTNLLDKYSLRKNDIDENFLKSLDQQFNVAQVIQGVKISEWNDNKSVNSINLKFNFNIVAFIICFAIVVGLHMFKGKSVNYDVIFTNLTWIIVTVILSVMYNKSQNRAEKIKRENDVIRSEKLKEIKNDSFEVLKFEFETYFKDVDNNAEIESHLISLLKKYIIIPNIKLKYEKRMPKTNELKVTELSYNLVEVEEDNSKDVPLDYYSRSQLNDIVPSLRKKTAKIENSREQERNASDLTKEIKIQSNKQK